MKELGSNNPLVREGAEHAILRELSDDGDGGATTRHRGTPGFTQVWDPCKEVKPLLLLSCIARVLCEGTMEDESLWF